MKKDDEIVVLKKEGRIKLNLGCGVDQWGDLRIDLVPTSSTNLVADAQRLPLRDATVSEVRETNLFEHLPNPAQHLLEVKRVLRKNGELTLITDNAACVKYYVLRTHTGGYRKHGGKDVHYALFTMEHIRNLFEYVGFVVVEIRYIDTDYFTRFFDWMVRLFVPSLSYPRIYARARKP